MSNYEFVKIGKRYILKNSNGRVVSEKEKIQMENKELILKDIEGCNCQKETTKKLTKNKKRLKEIEQEEKATIVNVEFSNDKVEPKAIVKIKETAPETKEADVDDIITETDKSI